MTLHSKTSMQDGTSGSNHFESDADLQVVGCQGTCSHEDGRDVLEALPGAGQLPLQRRPHLPRPPLQYCRLPIARKYHSVPTDNKQFLGPARLCETGDSNVTI